MNSERPEGSISSEWRNGWLVVLAAAVGGGTGISMYNIAAGLFIKPMQEELGWSRSALTLTPLIAVLLAVSSLPIGYLVDKYGSRRIAILGLIGLATGIVVLASGPPTKVLIYGTTAFIGCVSAAASIGPFSKGVATWFRNHPGGALGLTLTGPSLMSILVIPAVAATIHLYGWRAGYLCVAAFILFLGLPLTVLFFKEKPAPAPQIKSSEDRSGMTLGQSLRDWRYWALFVIMLITTIPVGGFMAHLQPMLTDESIGISEAASMGVLLVLSSSTGRATGGFLLDRYPPHIVAALFFICGATGAIMIAYISTLMLIAVAVIMIGLMQGAETDYMCFFTLKFFGGHSYTTILGSLTFPGSIGMGVGAYLFAAIFDRTGSYDLACYIASATYIFGCLATLAMGTLDRWQKARHQAAQVRCTV
jgi:nitrate/nitrite transporter NarK